MSPSIVLPHSQLHISPPVEQHNFLIHAFDQDGLLIVVLFIMWFIISLV
eukprot:UN16492